MMFVLNFLRRSCWGIIGLCFSFFLMGCHPNKASEVIPQEQTNQCDRQCLHEALLCQKTCLKSCATCQSKAQRRAEADDVAYVVTQKKQGLRVARELDSFRDPLVCQKVTCDCSQDYHTCRKRCRGQRDNHAQSKHCCAPNHLTHNRWRDVLGG